MLLNKKQMKAAGPAPSAPRSEESYQGQGLKF